MTLAAMPCLASSFFMCSLCVMTAACRFSVSADADCERYNRSIVTGLLPPHLARESTAPGTQGRIGASTPQDAG